LRNDHQWEPRSKFRRRGISQETLKKKRTRPIERKFTCVVTLLLGGGGRKKRGTKRFPCGCCLGTIRGAYENRPYTECEGMKARMGGQREQYFIVKKGRPGERAAERSKTGRGASMGERRKVPFYGGILSKQAERAPKDKNPAYGQYMGFFSRQGAQYEWIPMGNGVWE